MKNEVLALTIAVMWLVTVPTAVAATNVYGVVHVDAAQIDDGDDVFTDVTSNSSRVGVKGSEDLGGGLSALYKFEFAVDVSGDGELTGRNQHIGIASPFGTVLLGRFDTPYKQSVARLDPFEDTVADYNNVIGVNGALDIRARRIIAYATPELAGFSALIAHVPETTDKPAGNTGIDQDTRTTSVFLNYDAGTLFVGLGYLRIDDTDTRMLAGGSLKNAAGAGALRFEHVTGLRGGIGYSVGALEFGLVYEDTTFEIAGSDEQLKYVDTYLSAAYFAGSNALKLAYGTIDSDEENAILAGDASFSAVAIEHAFSKSTSSYIVYSRMLNDAGAMWTLGPAGVGPGHDVKPAPGEDPRAFAIGVIHKF